MIKNKKTGMVLSELLFAVTLSGILMGAAIYVFKVQDMTKAPYVYAGTKALIKANAVIMDECYNNETCKNISELPNSTKEYCIMLSDTLNVTVNSECNVYDNADGTLRFKKGDNKYVQNFRLSSGMSLYNINQGAWNNTLSNNFIDAYIDINGKQRGNNEIGDDIFPIRIFKNGEVIPAPDEDTLVHEDSEIFPYKIILNRSMSFPDRVNHRVKETLNANGSRKNVDETQTLNLPYKERVSFKEGICLINPDLLASYYGDDELETCGNVDTRLIACDFTSDDNPYKDDESAFCTLEALKPRGTGLFKFFSGD